MDKVVWLVAGNKGGVGKSVVAKALVEWLEAGAVDVVVADGDCRTPDVAAAFAHLPKVTFDLHGKDEWASFADHLCKLEGDLQVVTNMPDGLTERTIKALGRTVTLVRSYGFAIKLLFVMNTLPDGLHLLRDLLSEVDEVVAVKNLYFGRPAAFGHFDGVYGEEFEERTVLLPAMNPGVMRAVRDSTLSFNGFVAGDGLLGSTLYARYVTADWMQHVTEVFDDTLTAI